MVSNHGLDCDGTSTRAGTSYGRELNQRSRSEFSKTRTRCLRFKLKVVHARYLTLWGIRIFRRRRRIIRGSRGYITLYHLSYKLFWGLKTLRSSSLEDYSDLSHLLFISSLVQKIFCLESLGFDPSEIGFHGREKAHTRGKIYSDTYKQRQHFGVFKYLSSLKKLSRWFFWRYFFFPHFPFHLNIMAKKIDPFYGSKTLHWIKG